VVDVGRQFQGGTWGTRLKKQPLCNYLIEDPKLDSVGFYTCLRAPRNAFP